MKDRMLLGVVVAAAAAALLGFVGVATADTHPPSPIPPKKCLNTTPCKDMICGGITGCSCDNDGGIDVCTPI